MFLVRTVSRELLVQATCGRTLLQPLWRTAAACISTACDVSAPATMYSLATRQQYRPDTASVTGKPAVAVAGATTEGCAGGLATIAGAVGLREFHSTSAAADVAIASLFGGSGSAVCRTWTCKKKYALSPTVTGPVTATAGARVLSSLGQAEAPYATAAAQSQPQDSPQPPVAGAATEVQQLQTPASATAGGAPGGPAQKPKPGLTHRIMQLLPGVAAAVSVMVVGSWMADVGGKAVMAFQGLSGPSLVSGVSLAILLGVLINNTVTLPTALLSPGLRFCSKAVLQAGIVCVGAKVSLAEVAALGMAGLPVVGAAIASGLASVLWLNARLKLPPRMGLLTAAGTSICGVTAITAVAPAIQANQQEVAYAVANVVAFGLLGLMVYPVLAPHIMHTSEQVGLFLGTAIHDTSQVMGAALTYAQLYQDEVALKVAAVTKLTRNLALVFIIPLVAAIHARTQPTTPPPASPPSPHPASRSFSAAAVAAVTSAVAPTSATATTNIAMRPPRIPLTTLFPPFILGFLAMVVLRTVSDATGGSSGGSVTSPATSGRAASPTSSPTSASPTTLPTPSPTSAPTTPTPEASSRQRQWAATMSFVGSTLSGQLVGTAMAAIGLSTSFSVFKGVGLKPFAVGFVGAASVGLTGFIMARLLGGQLQIA